MMDGTDSAKFKIGCPADVRDVLFKTQSSVKNDTKITSRQRKVDGYVANRHRLSGSRGCFCIVSLG